MKSIICSFLLVSTTLSLLPFVAFSSTFISDNPIVRPTITEDNGVLDINGDPLHAGKEYNILSAVWGASSGAVDLAKIENTRCPNAVVLQEGEGLPVKFFTASHLSDVVRETNDIAIMFSIPSIPRCDNRTFWKVGNPQIPGGGLRFVETSPFLDFPNCLFQIQKLPEPSLFYKIRHCPRQGVECSDVGLTIRRGRTRLALTNQPLSVVFKKVQKTDA